MNNPGIEEQNTIDLKELFYLLLKNSWIIIVITLVFGAAALLFTLYGIDEEYESKTMIAVIVSKEEGNQTSDSLRVSADLAKRYSIIAKSNSVLDNVADAFFEEYGKEISNNQLKGLFTVQTIDSTDILEIKVTYTDPGVAQFLANSITEHGNLGYKETYENDNVKKIDEANYRDVPVSPNVMLNTLIGLVLGGMVSVGFVLLKEFINKKVRTEKDIEQLGISYLGSIQDLTKMKR